MLQWQASARADAWRQILLCVEDRDMPIECVQHCEAHRSRAAIAALAVQGQRAALADREVDRLAKQAAELDAGYGRDRAVQEASDRWPYTTWAGGTSAWTSGADMQEKPPDRPAKQASP